MVQALRELAKKVGPPDFSPGKGQGRRGEGEARGEAEEGLEGRRGSAAGGVGELGGGNKPLKSKNVAHLTKALTIGESSKFLLQISKFCGVTENGNLLPFQLFVQFNATK